MTTVLGLALDLGSSRLVLKEVPRAQGTVLGPTRCVEGRLRGEPGALFPEALSGHTSFIFLRLPSLVLSKAACAKPPRWGWRAGGYLPCETLTLNKQNKKGHASGADGFYRNRAELTAVKYADGVETPRLPSFGCAPPPTAVLRVSVGIWLLR